MKVQEFTGAMLRLAMDAELILLLFEFRKYTFEFNRE